MKILAVFLNENKRMFREKIVIARVHVHRTAQRAIDETLLVARGVLRLGHLPPCGATAARLLIADG